MYKELFSTYIETFYLNVSILSIGLGAGGGAYSVENIHLKVFKRKGGPKMHAVLKVPYYVNRALAKISLVWLTKT